MLSEIIMYQDIASIKDSESNVLIAIEQFLQDVCLEYYQDALDEMKRMLLDLITSFTVIHKDYLWYSSPIHVFMEVIKLVDYTINKLELIGYESILKFEVHHLYHIQGWIIYSMNKAKGQIHGFKSQEQWNRYKLEWYLSKLIQSYSRLLFVRIDLAILQKYQHIVGIAEFKNYLNTIMNRIANQDSCFRDLRGYVWALEQGEQKGYHCHLLLIYDGHKHQNDYGLGQLVGKCWLEITQQKGYFFNCNCKEHKENFIQQGRLGIGMIYRNDPQLVSNALEAAEYLVNPEKTNQYLRTKTSRQMKTFGTGQL